MTHLQQLTVLAALPLAALFLIDWCQTLRIASNPDRWHERNPFLGPHPSPRVVHGWFASCAVLWVFCALLLPPAIALTITLVALVAECWCVHNNYRLGIKP